MNEFGNGDGKPTKTRADEQSLVPDLKSNREFREMCHRHTGNFQES